MTIDVTLHCRGPLQLAGTRSGDPESPPTVPASALKGVMRHAARDVLGILPDIEERIFGSPTTARSLVEAPWAWTDAVLREPVVEPAPRIKLARAGNGLVESGFLALDVQTWSLGAQFTIVPMSVPAGQEEDDRLVLIASARAVTSIGKLRHRGFGWVTVTAGEWTQECSERLATLRKGTP